MLCWFCFNDQCLDSWLVITVESMNFFHRQQTAVRLGQRYGYINFEFSCKSHCQMYFFGSALNNFHDSNEKILIDAEH